MKKAFKDTKIGSFLLRVAPAVLDTVGTAFPAVKVLATLFDHELQVSPDQKKQFDELLADYELNELREHNANTADARDMQKVALGQDDKFSKRFLYWMASGSLLLGFAYIFLVTFVPLPEGNQRFADTILGVVIATVITTIYNFFFGSSKGSKDKDAITKTQ
jgi:hypothetical protein